ncbi:NADH-ubiquinone oxidoreductase [Nitrosomonas nitrosa]|uniref:NADH-ubiquinone oxidoreductase n=1 Tax=Nitrosomonas nitrosa TaxID=52442 RepID=A0A8H9D9J7_9PROT|nr:NADH-quinone oxidoreductase subunit K [Nitrosomonas nitrosa]CAE6509835.1 NADH-ubiquinone oxidoreductase [Nitrosomonas nitrosa]
MSSTFFFALAGIGLFVLGLYGLIIYAHLLRKILAINIMGSGVFLVLAGLAHRLPDGTADPISHAMIITGIVVAVAATALALVLMMQVQHTTGQAVLPEKQKY